MTIHPSLSMAAVVPIVVLAAGCTVVREEEDGKTTKVDIATPLGALAARTGEDTGDTGLPVVPGAQLSRDRSDGDQDRANVTIGTRTPSRARRTRRQFSDEFKAGAIRIEQQERVSRKRVVRLMQEEGLQARARKRYKRTTMSDPDQPVADNVLDRQFEAERPNQRWVGDTTEFVIGSSATLEGTTSTATARPRWRCSMTSKCSITSGAGIRRSERSVRPRMNGGLRQRSETVDGIGSSPSMVLHGKRQRRS